MLQQATDPNITLRVSPPLTSNMSKMDQSLDEIIGERPGPVSDFSHRNAIPALHSLMLAAATPRTAPIGATQTTAESTTEGGVSARRSAKGERTELGTVNE